MIIDRKIKKYIVFDEDPIVRGLEKISANNMRVIFVVNESGLLEGIVTDGDFRRWVVEQKNIDINQPISIVSNKNFTYRSINDDPVCIEKVFTSKIEYIPLVDGKMRLVAVASRRDPKFTIGDNVIDFESPAFIIAEVGNNHNGDIKLAKELVDKSAWAGANCVKFQMRNMAELYRNAGNSSDAGEDLGAQYVLDLLERFQLSEEELFEVFDYCKARNIIPLCTPWDKKSVQLLNQYGLAAFKVASADLTNHDLLTTLASTGKPLLCSTGMSTEFEIKAAVEHLNKLGAQFILLHCNSTYPAPFKDINLRYIEKLKEISKYPVGYSGHERGGLIAVNAVVLGAKIIEKHITLDRKMEGNDHKVSLLPEEFREMVRSIRQIEQALGSDSSRAITQGEMINREVLAKSLVINTNLPKGSVITEDMIEVKSPGKGLQPYRKKELIGRKAQRNFGKGEFFYPEDLVSEVISARDFVFSNPYGVPVRYHDAKQIASMCKMDILEIHLSYKDLELDIDDYFDAAFPHGLVVHSPELFSGDHILDLASTNDDYRNHSINELQKVIDLTNDLKRYFPNAEKPLIVVNVGGFSSDNFLTSTEKEIMYQRLHLSLQKINQDGVEIIPQTMPPFPWHFGGQRYHNLFVDIDEILNFCTMNNYRICLDVSHSKLACTHLKKSFRDFLSKSAAITAHLHIADARGVDGEGLQIGDGEIDFKSLMKTVEKIMPQASFIPEIWQGHKNLGQGFWVALDRLENDAHN